jgi:type VI secretion system protein ImpI/type VI secretion system protein
MALLLSVLRCPDFAVPEQRRVPGGDCTIGRGADCDWVLPDPEGVLSRRHCVLEFRSGGWQVRDLSTNGTFLNHAVEPIGRDRVRPIEDGDRLRLGGYEIELRIEQDAADPAPAWGGGAAAGPGWAAQDAAADPGWDPLAPPPPVGGAPAALPDDFDPFAEDAAPMPDHRPSVEDVFVPPRMVPAAPGAGGGTSGAAPAAGPGDDWDLDLSPPGGAPAPPGGARALDEWDLSPPVAPVLSSGPATRVAGQRAAPPPVPPVASPGPAAPPTVAPGQAPAQDDAEPFAEATPPTAAPLPATPKPTPAVSAAAVPATPEPPAASRLPPAAAIAVPAAAPHGRGEAAPAQAARAVATPAGTAPSGDGLAAFLAGAGLSPGALAGAVADPDATLRGLGAAFRSVVAGLRALLIARADVKREFRIEQTVLRAAGNNPVKFAATDDAAVLALAAQGAQGVRAVEETIADLTAHQVATLAATQAAARALLERLAPAGLEAEVKGGGSLFGASREKLLWDAYKKLHQQVVEQFEDDFDSAFGKAFARAYEQAARRDDGGAR